MWRNRKRPRGQWTKERLVGFRMQPEKFDALQKEAWASRKSIAEVINEALDVRLGWHPELFEKKAAGKK